MKGGSSDVMVGNPVLRKEESLARRRRYMDGESLLYNRTGQRRDEIDKRGGCFPKLDK